MGRLLQNLRALHATYRQNCPQVNAEGLAQAEALLARVEADGKANGKLLTYLDQYVVPTFDFAQAYYNLNTPTTEHLNDFPGSLNHRIRVVCCALREERDDYLGRGGFVMAIYPDYAVVCYQEGYCWYEDTVPETYWMVPYTYDEGTGDVAFGERTQVEVKTVVMPVQPDTPSADDAGDAGVADDAAMVESAKEPAGEPVAQVEFAPVASREQAATETLDQAAKTKTENGQKFGAGAYLIVPDANLPSTWKVRVEESPGKVTVPQLGRAYAALTSGFRGNKVQATPAQIAAAKRKLRSLYKSHDAPWPGDKKQASDECPYPAWLLQGDDPPGGEEELVQTITVRLQQEGEVGDDGVMHVEGIATVADIVSKNQEVYPLEVWQDNLPRLQSMIEQGRLTGECDHPDDNQATLGKTSLKFTSIWQDDNQIKFKADILPTVPDGNNLQVLVKNGVAVDISSRGRGRMVQGTWQGISNVKIVQRGFRCDAFDAVKSGASPGSTITDWSLAQSEGASNVDQEEIEMPEVSEKILEALQGLQQAQAKQAELLATLAGAGQNGASNADAGTQTQGAQPANDAAVGAATGGAQVTHSREEWAFIAQQAAEMRIESELRGLVGVWPQPWINLLRKQLEQAAPKTLSEANTVIQSRRELVQQMLDQAPKFPGQGFVVQKDRGQSGPQTPNEAIERLVEGLPDVDDNDDPLAFMWQDSEGKSRKVPDWLKSPKRQCRKVLQNMATLRTDGFDGPAAITALMRLDQGWDHNAVAADFLNQSCTDGTTTVASGGAPTSTIFLFPLIRRVFPLLIANELASVQPMDRPSGKIFFKDTYRIESDGSETDESGNVSSSRLRIDRSESFNPDYSDYAAECDTAKIIQLHLSSKDVTAEDKALHAIWTIKELQDLRAYHNLNVQEELVGDIALQIALEWNETILAEMLAGATAGNANFLTTAPSGFTAKEWEEYLPRYIEYISMKIFQKRHGDMTHIVAGPLAWLKLSAAYRVGTKPAGVNPEQFAGLTLTPFMEGSMSNVRTYKTSFWNKASNQNKILIIRRGATWSDTPYVWAPYATYMSPILTLPDTMTQKQGIMDRAAHKVVVGDALGTISIGAGTGVPINDLT